MDESLTAALHGLKLEFIASARQAILDADALLAALERAPDVHPPLVELRRLFHRLTGSGGTYGLPRVSELGARGEGECEQVLDQRRQVAADDLERWRALLAEADQEMVAAAGVPRPRTPDHLLIISTRAQLAALADGSTAARAELTLTADAAEVDRILRRRRPGAVVLDLELAEAELFLEQLTRRPELAGVTLVGMSPQLTPAHRIDLAQRGISCFVAPGASIEELLLAAAPSPLAPEAKVGRALLLSEDAALSRSLVSILEPLGIELDLCADRARLLGALEARAAELILIDAPGVTDEAVALARELRASARTLGAALLLLAPSPDAELRRVAIEAGVDEIIPRDEPAVVEARLRERAALALSLLERGAARLVSAGSLAARELPAERRTADPVPGVADPVRVLVADDDPALRDLIRLHLERLGWQVVLAEDGEQAERALTEQAFHIALLDVLMPFRSGFDLLEWVNANRDHRPLKIVILTALGQDENLLRAFDLGADDFIAKPVSPDAIVGRLRRLLRPA